MDNRLFFLHIPKTGGRYVWSLIEQMNFGWTPKWAPNTWRALFNEGRKAIDAVDGTSGHLIYDVSGLWPNSERELSTYTMLRDPIDRVVSQYYWVLKNHGDTRRLSLEDFLEHSFTRMLVQNTMTKMIGTSFTVSDVRRVMGRYHSIDGDCGVFEAIGQSEHIDTLLDKAKERIDFDLMCVGITERMIESMDLFVSRSGHKPPRSVEQKQKRDYTDLISGDELALIIKLNQADIELYRYANQALDQQLKVIDT